MSSPRPDLEDYYSGAFLRWESQYVTKIAIARYEGSSLSRTNVEQILVGHAEQSLIANRYRVVPRCLEKLETATADIFIEFKLHATRSIGTGKTRSRAASAPY